MSLFADADNAALLLKKEHEKNKEVEQAKKDAAQETKDAEKRHKEAKEQGML